MYRFYVSADQLAEKEVFISGGDVNHIKNVLRLEVGDWIVACDGNGTDYVSRIQSICSDEVVASIEKVQPTGTELPVRITLFQGMPKKDKLELIIQKAVELGACEIVPVMTKRPGGIIVRSAASQCSAVDDGARHLLEMVRRRGPSGLPTITVSTMLRNRPCSTTPTVLIRSSASSVGWSMRSRCRSTTKLFSSVRTSLPSASSRSTGL